tara:strand:+ start:8248 stop:8754 length:507 start_codon:yes stop_codon:yes gene_type:complete
MRVFTETQRFNQWWLHLLNLAMFVSLGYIAYQWFIAKEAVDKVASNDSIGQVVVIFSLLLVPLVLYTGKLSTKIDERGIHYQFLPFHWALKTILWHDMETCRVRTYSPIKEYGGWGYRRSLRNGKAFNVKGGVGIQIILKTGKKILIGTQRENEVRDILKRYSNKITT